MNFDLVQTLYLLPGIIIGFTFHEFAHAQTAVWFGDDTPRAQGRISLNPLVHIDLIGFIMIVFAGFGWAKPVQVNPNNFRNKKRDDILVSLAGPVMNIFIACFFFILMRIIYFVPSGFLDENTFDIIFNIFNYAAWINVVLFVFNLIPIPPLDGSHIIFGLAGLMESKFYYQISRMSTFILLILIITNLISKIISPPIMFIYDNLSGLFF